MNLTPGSSSDERRLAIRDGSTLALPHVAAASAGSVKPDALDLSLLMRVAYEWRWLIVAVFTVGIAIAIIASLLTTPVYRSVTTIELNPPQVQAVESEGSERAAATADIAFIGTQLGLLRSAALAERIAQDQNLAASEHVADQELPRSARDRIATSVVRNAIDVELQPQSRLVTIEAQSTDPGTAARIANGAAESYINSTLERRYQSSSYARDFLQRQIATVRRDLERSERQLVEYAQQQRLITTAPTQTGTGGNSLAGESLTALNNALAVAQARRFGAEQRYRESLSAGPTSEVNERTAELRSQVAGLNAEYQQRLATFRPDYPDMVRLRAQIDALNASIREEAGVARASRTGTLREEFAAARAEEANLQTRVSQLSSEVLNIRGRNVRYNILQRDVDTNRQLYDGLLQRYKEIGVAGGVGTAIAGIVDRGSVPTAPFKPNFLLNILIGAFTGLVFGMLAALGLEFVNDTIKTPEDVRNKLRVPFLGGIPVATGSPVEALSDSTSPVSEAYFALANSLQYTSETGVPKSVMVTSTRPAEGKSTSALALASSFTKLGKSVLLIDADMRRPAFANEKRDQIGLSKLLTNASALKDSVIPTQIEQLWLVPAGPIPPNPAELLASPRLAELIDEAGHEFDVVVVDGPPMLGLADSPAIANAVRATVLVIEAGKTRTRAATEAFNRLHNVNAQILGAILTRYKAQTAYGYGYRYGTKDESYSYKLDDKKRRLIQITHQQAG